MGAPSTRPAGRRSFGRPTLRRLGVPLATGPFPLRLAAGRNKAPGRGGNLGQAGRPGPQVIGKAERRRRRYSDRVQLVVGDATDQRGGLRVATRESSRSTGRAAIDGFTARIAPEGTGSHVTRAGGLSGNGV